MIWIKAPAKLNLVLEILGKRSDGYHEISGIMQAIDLCDELAFTTAEKLSLQCDVAELHTDDNLILKAANVLKQRCAYSGGAAIELRKKIPWSAGLGGGSSNAAVTLLALNRLWSTGLNKNDLIELAAAIGSDVPFFIHGGTCLVEGRGDRLNALPDLDKAWFLLIIPDIKVPPLKTAAMYRMVKPEVFSRGQHTGDLLRALDKHKGVEALRLHNVFDSLAIDAYPQIEKYILATRRAGAGEVHLAGAGPALYSMFDSKEKAGIPARKLKLDGINTFVVSSLERGALGY